MVNKIKAVVLGATGMVGQRFIHLLQNHPWFEITAIAASERTTGKLYRETGKWVLSEEIPSEIAELEVKPVDPKAVEDDVKIAFSGLPADIALKAEEDFAKAGFIVLSNTSSHRMDPDVPILNPEANAEHIALIDEQRLRRGWEGAIVTNPNCTAAVLSLSLKPILDTFGLKRVLVSTMQAVSGAGYPGVASLDILDNIIPFIKGEEEKVQAETLKILGTLNKPAKFEVSASCHRVATLDGHLEAVFVETERKAEPIEVIEVMKKFRGEPQMLKLPNAPETPVMVTLDEFRPQPRRDRMAGDGMSIVVGRVRLDEALPHGIKYVVLGHNTIRGAAGCSILNAELLKVKRYM